MPEHDLKTLFQQEITKGTPEIAYTALRDWVRKNPVHSVYRLPAGQTLFEWDWSTRMVSDDIQSCDGLQSCFDDRGYISWIVQQKTERGVKPQILENAVFMAAGYDRVLALETKKERVPSGRLGRLLTLRSLGADLSAKGRAVGAYHSGVADLLAGCCPSALLPLVRAGLDLQAVDESGWPPLFRLVRWGTPEAMQALLEAGASRDAKDAKGATALQFAKTWKADPRKLVLLGAKKKKATLDTAPLEALIEKRRAEWAKSRWGRSVSIGKHNLPGIRALCERAAFSGAKDWSAAVTSNLELLDPEELFVLALALAELAPKNKKPTILKPQPSKSCIVVGDATVEGRLSPKSGVRIVVTGSLHCDEFADDESIGVFVAGDVSTGTVESEGDFWIGGDLDCEKSIHVFHEEGVLVVGGTLRAPLLEEDGRHSIVAAKLETGKSTKRHEP